MATTTQSSVVAVYRNRSDAENAANELRSSGFDSSDIYVGAYDEAGTTGTTREWKATQHHEGGIKGWFKSLFGDESDSSDYTNYENVANTGGVIVSVRAPEQQIDRAVDILEKYNPVDVDQNAGTTGAQTGSTAAASQGVAATGAATQTPQTTAGTAATRGRQATDTGDLPRTIPVVEEDLRVGKRSVVRGGVRVYSRVVEQPVEETVNLREERVRVDRQPVNRPVDAGELRAGTDQVIEVQEVAEEPVVQKQARVVEEVRVSKEVGERSETIRDTVRRQEVEVEDLGQGSGGTAATGTGSYTDDFRSDFQTRYGTSGGSYQDYEPAYTYGYNAASDPRYQGRSWDDVESDLRSDYGRQYPNSTWERMKDAIRYGWDKVTGKVRGATTTNR